MTYSNRILMVRIIHLLGHFRFYDKILILLSKCLIYLNRILLRIIYFLHHYTSYDKYLLSPLKCLVYLTRMLMKLIHLLCNFSSYDKALTSASKCVILLNRIMVIDSKRAFFVLQILHTVLLMMFTMIIIHSYFLLSIVLNSCDCIVK
jgi:hypothetical protein